MLNIGIDNLCTHGGVRQYVVNEFTSSVTMRVGIVIESQELLFETGVDDRCNRRFAVFAIEVTKNQNIRISGHAAQCIN